MAQIDSLIARLVQSKAQARRCAQMHRRNGCWRPPHPRFGHFRGPTPIPRAGILPETKRSEWDSKRVFTFPYSSPNGVFEITVNPRTEKLEVSLRPAGASTKTSASDAEMPAAIPTTIPAAMQRLDQC